MNSCSIEKHHLGFLTSGCWNPTPSGREATGHILSTGQTAHTPYHLRGTAFSVLDFQPRLEIWAQGCVREVDGGKEQGIHRRTFVMNQRWPEFVVESVDVDERWEALGLVTSPSSSTSLCPALGLERMTPPGASSRCPDCWSPGGRNPRTVAALPPSHILAPNLCVSTST